MRPTPRTALVGAVLLALGGVATADPKSDALFQQAREMLAAARTLEAEVVQTVVLGDEKGSRHAAVRLMKPNLGWKVIKSQGSESYRPDTTVISDGQNHYEVIPSAKKYQRMPALPKGMRGPADYVPLRAFYAPETLVAGADCQYSGTREVEGKRYEVVQFSSKQPTEGRTRYYFGASGLLEGMEVDLKVGLKSGTLSVWVKNLRLGASFTEKEFAYTPPADFKVYDPIAELEASLLKVGTNAPDFRLPQPDGSTLTLSSTRLGKKAVLINFWFYT